MRRGFSALLKALRFGLGEIYADQPLPRLTNAQRIQHEMAGLHAAYEELVRAGLLDLPNHSDCDKAIAKALKYMEYSRKLGILTD